MARYCCSLCAVLLIMGPVVAEGLLFQLPADGAKATFAVDLKVQVEGKERHGKGAMTMASVGKVSREGEPCRWIEFNFQLTMGEDKQQHLIKALIPEKHLKAGATPFNHILIAWEKNTLTKGDQTREGKVKKVDLKDLHGAPLPAFLSGPYQDEKKLGSETVESGLGKLDCAGLSGRITHKERSQTLKVEFLNRLHSKAPFGVVSCTMKFQVEREVLSKDKKERKTVPSGTGTISFRLGKTGTGAKSELVAPEEK
jgi:hypothetical protein